jgi:hypothetical protein
LPGCRSLPTTLRHASGVAAGLAGARERERERGRLPIAAGMGWSECDHCGQERRADGDGRLLPHRAFRDGGMVPCAGGEYPELKPEPVAPEPVAPKPEPVAAPKPAPRRPVDDDWPRNGAEPGYWDWPWRELDTWRWPRNRPEWLLNGLPLVLREHGVSVPCGISLDGGSGVVVPVMAPGEFEAAAYVLGTMGCTGIAPDRYGWLTAVLPGRLLSPPEPRPAQVKDRERAHSRELGTVAEVALRPCSKCGKSYPADSFPVRGSQRHVCQECDEAVRAARAQAIHERFQPGVPEGHKRCSGPCAGVKELSAFPWWSKAEGRRGPRCLECDREAQRLRYAQRRARAAAAVG